MKNNMIEELQVKKDKYEKLAWVFFYILVISLALMIISVFAMAIYNCATNFENLDVGMNIAWLAVIFGGVSVIVCSIWTYFESKIIDIKTAIAVIQQKEED